MRKYSLDELPQFINVFKGEMSLVGPRPERIHFINLMKGTIPKYLERHRVKSGITGGHRSTASEGLIHRLKKELSTIFITSKIGL